MNPEGGSKNLTFSVHSTESVLHDHLRLSWVRKPKLSFFLRAETFYNTASAYEEVGSSAFRPPPDYHNRSHGESFLEVIRGQFNPNGFFIMDEPESALSVTGQLRLLRAMHDLTQFNCQFLVATHSPILLAFPGAEILELDEEGMTDVQYGETEQYQLTKSFLEAPERFFRHLFSDE